MAFMALFVLVPRFCFYGFHGFSVYKAFIVGSNKVIKPVSHVELYLCLNILNTADSILILAKYCYTTHPGLR